MHRQRVFIWNWKYVESMNAFCTWFVLGRQFIFTFHVRPHLYTCALQMALFMNLTQKNMPAFSRIMRSKRELEYMYESSMQQLLVEVLLMYSPSNFFFEKKRKVNSHLIVINLLKFHPLTIHYVLEMKIMATALSAESRMDEKLADSLIQIM